MVSTLRHSAIGALLLSGYLTAMVHAVDLRTDPAHRLQRFSSWGVSLAWSGNAIGGWEDGKVDALMDRLFDPTNHLGFTFARYNIGGGQNPFLLSQMRPGGAVPGWVPDFVPASHISQTASWQWDWNADPRQRNTLNEALERGVRHAEAFILSPPYWMTITGDSSGGVGGGQNLLVDHYDEYAHYMTEVVRHFQDDRGIFFETLSPMNEPNQSWWVAGNAQEGMHVPRGFHQRLLVEHAGQALAAKNLETTISATDAFNASSSRNNYQQFNDYTKSFVSTIGTHTYGNNSSSDLANLRQTAAADGKRLIVSEYGNNSQGGLQGGIPLAKRIQQDLNGMQVETWTYWQGIEWDNGSGWGLVRQDFLDASEDHIISKQYHVMRQYAAHIRPGAHVLATSDQETVAAYDPGREVTSIVIHRDTTATTKNFQVTDQPIHFSRSIQTTDAGNYVSLGAAPVSGSSVSPFLPRDSVTTVMLYHRPNLLANSGFLYPAGATGALDAIDGGWVAEGDAGFYDLGSASNGTDTGVAVLRADAAHGEGSLRQHATGSPEADLTGVAYQLSIDILFANDTLRGDQYASETWIGLEFLAADGTTLTHGDTQDFLTPVGPDMDDAAYRLYHSQPVVAPAGTRFVRPLIQFENSAVASNHWVYVDNAYLQAVDLPQRGTTWDVDAGGTFQNAHHWRRDVLEEYRHHYLFGDVITQNRIVTVDEPILAAGLGFDSPKNYTLAGSAPITLSDLAEPVLIDVREGQHRVATVTRAASDLLVRTLPEASLTLDRLQLMGQTLTKQGAGTLHLGFGFDMDGGALHVDLSATPTISISSLAHLDGTLQLAFPIGMSAELGDVFAPIGYVNGSEPFQDIVLPTLPSGWTWDVSYLADALQLTVIASLTGDFNGDGLYDCTDVDTLVTAIAQATHPSSFDLNSDGLVDLQDLTAWLAEAGENAPLLTHGRPFLPGDANLDGVVDVTDFNIWNTGKFSSDAGWCGGDFTADGFVDTSDFNVWNSRKFTASQAVPEPEGWISLVGALLLIHRLRLRRGRPGLSQ